jgi:hypothetical protein
MNAAEIGLCARCRHSKEIRTDRGSSFIMCLRSFREPEYLKYPRLPVLRCAGFEERDQTEYAGLSPD